MKKSRIRAEIAAEISWAARTMAKAPKCSSQFYDGYIDGLNYALLVLSDSEGGRKGSDGKSYGEAEKTRQSLSKCVCKDRKKEVEDAERT